MPALAQVREPTNIYARVTLGRQVHELDSALAGTTTIHIVSSVLASASRLAV